RFTPRLTLFPYTTLFRSEYMLQYSSSRLPSSLELDSVEQTLTGDLRFLTQAVHYTIRSLREGGLFCDTFLKFVLENTRERIGAGDRKSTRLNSSHVSISY